MKESGFVHLNFMPSTTERPTCCLFLWSQGLSLLFALRGGERVDSRGWDVALRLRLWPGYGGS